MSADLILWPLIAQAALTYAIYLVVSRRRMGAIYSGRVEAKAFLVPVTEPEPSATAIRSLSNQFELPVLFFAGGLACHLAGAVDAVSLTLAWVFVATRIAHAGIHVTTNRLALRRGLFIAGFAVNGLLWLYLAWSLALG